MDLGDFYKDQISLTEWFEQIQHKDSLLLRKEDNEKRDRLEKLSQLIKLPYDKPIKFKATDLLNKTSKFLTFFEEKKDDICSLRLIPYDPSLPKLRLRGYTVENVMHWFHEQKIDYDKYQAQFLPHAKNNTWSTIFIIGEKGIFGEIIKGGHYQLTQGFYEKTSPIIFSFDFKQLYLKEQNEEIRDHLMAIIHHLKVDNKEMRERIQKEIGAHFVQQYLKGYFETVTLEDYGLWFVDYNRILGDLYKQFFTKGQCASPGKAQGKVRIIKNPKQETFEEGNILVCEMTSPDYIPLMQKANAIITEKEGILTHAAIIARELKKPCIVGIGKTTLREGEYVEIDAEQGLNLVRT